MWHKWNLLQRYKRSVIKRIHKNPLSHRFVKLLVSYYRKLTATTWAIIMNMTTYISQRIWKRMEKVFMTASFQIVVLRTVIPGGLVNGYQHCGEMLSSSSGLKHQLIIDDVEEMSLSNSRRLRHGDIINICGALGVEEISLSNHRRLSHGNIIIMSDAEEMSQPHSRRQSHGSIPSSTRLEVCWCNHYIWCVHIWSVVT